MKLRNVFSKGIYLKRQRAGQAETGPLAPVLREFSRARTDKPGANFLPAQGSLQPVSPVGFDLAQIIIKTTFRVLFVNTDGSGVAPWRGLIVLDADYRGAGQVESPHRIGLVAHELTHLLQRDIKGSHYWPGGGLNPVRGRRWMGDSTNYMEMLAYLVGWSVEHDLTAARQRDPNISEELHALDELTLATIQERLARFTNVEAHMVSEMICELFPDNPIYEQNLRTESRYPDRRIPPGTWHGWLRQMGFSRFSVDHIMILAAQGQMG